jgi:hypothetical protein
LFLLTSFSELPSLFMRSWLCETRLPGNASVDSPEMKLIRAASTSSFGREGETRFISCGLSRALVVLVEVEARYQIRNKRRDAIGHRSADTNGLDTTTVSSSTTKTGSVLFVATHYGTFDKRKTNSITGLLLVQVEIATSVGN